MKLSNVALFMGACSSAVANPVHELLYRRDVANGTTVAGGSNSSAAGDASNGTATASSTSPSRTAATNVTGGGYGNSSSGSGSSSGSSGSVSVFVTGGTSTLSNSSGVDVNWLFNSSQSLNVTQLYQIAIQINQTLGQGSNNGVVIVSNAESLESLGFFSSLVFNTDKPIVIAQNAATGAAIAQDPSSKARGPLVLGDNHLIYPGVFAPSAGETSSCAAVGIASDASNATWFFENSVPALTGPSSVIKQNYTNFTNIDVQNTPVVPIIYDGGYSTQIISSLTSASGFVIVSSGVNSTTSSIGNTSVPVVFAEGGSGLHFVGDEDVPQGTIPAGYLSPVKAQIVLSVAAVNGVSSSDALRSLFP